MNVLRHPKTVSCRGKQGRFTQKYFILTRQPISRIGDAGKHSPARGQPPVEQLGMKPPNRSRIQLPELDHYLL